MYKRWSAIGGLFISLLILATGHSSAQVVPQPNRAMRTKMDEDIRRCLQQDGTPSASVAVVEGGQITYLAAFGDAVLHPKKAASEKTRYQLASISKTFTAQAILLLEADGKLSLEDKVSKWYPGLSGA